MAEQTFYPTMVDDFDDITITEQTKKDITSVTIEVSIGTDRLPGSTWTAATVFSRPNVWTARFRALVGGTGLTLPAGDSWVWIRVTDGAKNTIWRSPLKLVSVTA